MLKAVGWASMVHCLALTVVVSWTMSHASAQSPNVLDIPALMQQQATDNLRAVALLRKGEHGSAKLILRQCVLRVPHDLMSVYNLACAHALLGQPDEAIEMLQVALKLGFRNKQQLQMDKDLASLRDKPEFAEILKGCDEPPLKTQPGWHYDVQVAKPQATVLTVDHNNMSWNPVNRVMQVFVDASESGKDRLAAGTTGAFGDKVIQWYADGTAAGNVGDLYDNHDRGHSRLDPARFPQLTHIAFGPETQKRQLDNGPQRTFLYLNAQSKPTEKTTEKSATDNGAAGTKLDAPTNSLQVSRTIVIGNSSTAATGSPFWRSMPRLVLTSGGGPELLSQHYTHNHLYVYPEHKDHDPGHDEATGWGDVFFANTPFYLVSQGSSGTDQPILDALAATLSAFHPETKQVLRDRGLIAPTLQMIFRHCYKPVHSDEDYLSGKAHPTVFDGSLVDVDRMVEMAHAMKKEEIPPIALLRILKEAQPDPSRDYFDAQPSEAPLTTPFAIARVCNATGFWREMIVTGADSLEANKRPLEYHWVVLRGDPELVKIEEVSGNRDARRIRIGYHTRRPIQPGADIESSRVDIAVFANNGVYYSAPAFLSFMFPENETRVYDDQKRIQSVDYRGSIGNYVDPALVAERLWKDDYHYDGTGKLTGWTRTRGRNQEEFNAKGELLVPGKDKGAPTAAKRVSYQRLNHTDGRPFIQQTAVEE